MTVNDPAESSPVGNVSLYETCAFWHGISMARAQIIDDDDSMSGAY
jgi:hypothetical protein